MFHDHIWAQIGRVLLSRKTDSTEEFLTRSICNLLFLFRGLYLGPQDCKSKGPCPTSNGRSGTGTGDDSGRSFVIVIAFPQSNFPCFRPRDGAFINHHIESSPGGDRPPSCHRLGLRSRSYQTARTIRAATAARILLHPLISALSQLTKIYGCKQYAEFRLEA
jgi:hypothetical protein